MQKYEISQKLIQAIVNFLSTLPWNQVNQILGSIASEVKENEERNLSKEKKKRELFVRFLSDRAILAKKGVPDKSLLFSNPSLRATKRERDL